MLLWIVFAAMTAVVALAIVQPYWRRHMGGGAPSHDLAVYKEQLREIEHEQARGLLGEAEYSSARIEISRRILAASAAADGDRPGLTASPLAPYVMLSLLATVTVAVYLIYGSPEMRDQPLAARVAEDGNPPIERLVARVEERLQEHPEDGAGWTVVAPVYMRLGRYADAASAFQKAIGLLGETPDRLGDLGEALAFANDGNVGDEARAAFRKAQSHDPSNARAAFWLAIAQEQDGKLAEAAQGYKTLIGRGPGRQCRNARQAAAGRRRNASRRRAVRGYDSSGDDQRHGVGACRKAEDGRLRSGGLA